MDRDRGSLAALPPCPNELPDKLPGCNRETHDLFDRHLVLRQRKDRGVDLFAPLMAFI
jgi:hypothetical protein